MEACELDTTVNLPDDGDECTVLFCFTGVSHIGQAGNYTEHHRTPI